MPYGNFKCVARQLPSTHLGKIVDVSGYLKVKRSGSLDGHTQHGSSLVKLKIGKLTK